MPQLWILMDNSKKRELSTDSTTAWTTQKAALYTYPQPLRPFFWIFKDQKTTNPRAIDHIAVVEERGANLLSGGRARFLAKKWLALLCFLPNRVFTMFYLIAQFTSWII